MNSFPQCTLMFRFPSCFYFFFKQIYALRLGIVFAKAKVKTKVSNVHQGKFQGGRK